MADGAAEADAIRLVGTGPAPLDVIDVLADRVGMSQRTTDDGRALIWRSRSGARPRIANDLRVLSE